MYIYIIQYLLAAFFDIASFVSFFYRSNLDFLRFFSSLLSL